MKLSLLVLTIASTAMLFDNADCFQPTMETKKTMLYGRSKPTTILAMSRKAGTFFNPVPEKNNDDSNDNDDATNSGDSSNNTQDELDESLKNLMKKRNTPPKASKPSTINGVPTSLTGVGFGQKSNAKAVKADDKPFVGIGPPDKAVNDVTKPEYDDQGYTIYTDENTGEKARVFEALVEYPCDFTMKIVGAAEGAFVEEMVAVVAECCEVEVNDITHSTRMRGKWTSITVQAPVKSAEMLYTLYESVDRDPRVKFKF